MLQLFGFIYCLILHAASTKTVPPTFAPYEERPAYTAPEAGKNASSAG